MTVSIAAGVTFTETQLTFSKPLPLSIRSVVAVILPPFLCRSHMIVRRSIWGNICWIVSTPASRTRTLPRPGNEFDVRDDGELEKNSHRMAIPPMTSTSRSCGMLIVCSAIMMHCAGSAVTGPKFMRTPAVSAVTRLERRMETEYWNGVGCARRDRMDVRAKLLTWRVLVHVDRHAPSSILSAGAA